MNMLKRILCLLTALLTLCSCAGAELLSGESDEDVDVGLVYDAAEQIGTVINLGEPTVTDAQRLKYAFTPVDVVLVLDVSASMADTNPATNRTLLSYAQDAAAAFARTLYAVNPDSRIGVVAFDTTARRVCGMKTKSEQQTLLGNIHSLFYSGNTNTGDGFREGADLLNASYMDGRRRIMIMITDGLANEGGSDPRQYAIQQGRAAATLGNVYTIGLVGGLDKDSKNYTRQVLSAGYESRYFEVDFDSVGDMGAQLTNIMTTIPVAASANEALRLDGSVFAMNVYALTVEDGYEVTVAGGDEMLSSRREDYNEQTTFGSMSMVDGKMTFVMLEGNYEIHIKGVKECDSGYSLVRLSGSKLTEEVLRRNSSWSHPSLHTQIELIDGEMKVSLLNWNPIDPRETDDQGRPVNGTENPAGALVEASTMVYAAPKTTGEVIMQLPKMSRVRVLCRNKKENYSLVSFTDDDGLVRRGWVKSDLLKRMYGFVPDAPELGGSFTVAQNVTTRFAPDARAAEAYPAQAGSTVELIHVDRDAKGEEWAYVSISTGKAKACCAYIPVSALQDWKTLTVEDFAIGKSDPLIELEIEYPEMTNVRRGQMLAVYSAPSKNAWRGAKNKAAVDTSGGLYAAGWVDNNWLMVMYGTSKGNRRAGYIYGEDIKDYFTDLPQVNFMPRKAKVTVRCILTDDPDKYSEEIATLKKGTEVTYLAEYAGFRGGQPFHYIETKVDSKVVRGFVPLGCLDIEE